MTEDLLEELKAFDVEGQNTKSNFQCITWQKVLYGVVATAIFVIIPVFCIPEMTKLQHECTHDFKLEPTIETTGIVTSCQNLTAEAINDQNKTCTLYDLRFCPAVSDQLSYFISSEESNCALDKSSANDKCDQVAFFCVMYFLFGGHCYFWFMDLYLNKCKLTNWVCNIFN